MDSLPPILVDLPEQLDGERVSVRPWLEGDSRALWDAVDESRNHLEPWMPWMDGYNNPDDALEYTRRAYARWLVREDLAVAIVERQTRRIVGGSGLHRIDWQHRLFEIGYWLRTDAEGRGYAQETVQLLTRLAFDELDANRVQVRMDTRNERSRRVVERLGFVHEGTLRRALPAPGGLPADVHIYALVPEEYAALPWATRFA
ncbi:MAG: GNAT family N-acetyltransferase [Chloroflexota bacterium]